MVFGFLKNKISPIAVDIGTESIKVLQTEPGDEQVRLIAAASATIPEELRTQPRERSEFVAEAIRKILQQGNFKGTKAVTCLPASDMVFQHLRMAKMSEEELRKALPYEAQGKLPFDPGRSMLRHVVSTEVFQDQEPKNEVILMAASRESVERHLGILDKSKLEVVGIHVEPSALIECFSHVFNRKGDEEVSTLFIDMGAGSTHVVISHARHMVFAKHIRVGGATFTKKAAEALKLGTGATQELRVKMAQEATAARLPTGVVSIGSGGFNNGNGHAKLDPDVVARIQAAIAEPLETLVSELELCVRYYESIFPGKNIHRIIFVGGESRHLGVCQKVAQRLGIAATLGDPLARLSRDEKTKCDFDLRTPQPGWAVAVGLGLGITGE